MSADENRAVVRRWVEAWNEKDLNAAEELLGPDYVRHDANLPEVVGPQAERQFIAGVIAAFPDLHLQTEQLVAEDDLVACRSSRVGVLGGTIGRAESGADAVAD